MIGDHTLRRWKGTVFFAVGATFVLFSATAAALVISQEGLSANGAAWVQAGGAIAAILGAVWRVESEQALRRQERRAVGEELAGLVRFALTDAQLEARTIAAELIADNLLECDEVGRQWSLRTANCANVLSVYAEQPDHIQRALNHIASKGVLLLRQLGADIARALTFVEKGERPSMQSAADIAWYESHFESLILLLDARMRGLVLALDETADQIPWRHRQIWRTLRQDRDATLGRQ